MTGRNLPPGQTSWPSLFGAAYDAKAAAAAAQHILEAKLRAAMRNSIDGAKRRQAKKPVPAAVTVTVEQLMAKLRANDYRCAVSGLPFWDDDAPGSFGPTIPSVDRIDSPGDYSDENTRVVLLGVNGLRGQGSDADMVRIAKAIVARDRRSRSHRAAG